METAALRLMQSGRRLNPRPAGGNQSRRFRYRTMPVGHSAAPPLRYAGFGVDPAAGLALVLTAPYRLDSLYLGSKVMK